LIVSLLAGSTVLFTLSAVAILVFIGLFGRVPVAGLLIFALWMALALLWLLIRPWPAPVSGISILGLPAAAAVMIFGIWIAPIWILPLVFMLKFSDWMKK
jgi:hypothetical protein